MGADSPLVSTCHLVEMISRGRCCRHNSREPIACGSIIAPRATSIRRRCALRPSLEAKDELGSAATRAVSILPSTEYMPNTSHIPIGAVVLAVAIMATGCSGDATSTSEPQLQTETSQLRTNCLAQFDRFEAKPTRQTLTKLMDNNTVAAAECAEYGALLESIRAVDAVNEDDMAADDFGFGFVTEEEQP